MTADIDPQRNQSGLGTRLPVLTLAFAALTLLFALLSMIFGSRLSTLQTSSLMAHNETAASGAASMAEMKTALKTATVNLKTAQQTLETEKAAAHRLRKQISVLTEDLENTQVDLAKANQTITAIKSAGSLESILSLETPEEKVDQVAPSVFAPPSPDIPPPVAEVPITDSPQELPEAAPASD